MVVLGKAQYSLRIIEEVIRNSLQKFKVLPKPSFDREISLEGHVIIITGGNRGIGRGTAELLAQQGARIILATFEIEEAKQVARENPQAKIDVHFLDLASFKSIKSFAETILAKEERIDCLINNAAVMCKRFTQTEDGFEIAKQVNFLSPILLTKLLLPLIEKSKGRVLNMGSLAHCLTTTMKPEDENWWWRKKNNSTLKTYSKTKLASLLATRYLSKELYNRGVKCYAIDPEIAKSKMIYAFEYSNWKLFMTNIFYSLIKTPNEAAISVVCGVLHDGKEYIPGEKYHLNYGQFKKTSKIADDDKNAEIIWSHATSLIAELNEL